LASRRQGALRWSIVVGYLLLALGVPLPLATGKSNGEPYPCMDHQCGCISAEECWRHCCCMSMVEKLTWAREHKVNPPLYVVLEARQHNIDWIAFYAGSTVDRPKQNAGCCAHCGHDSASVASDDLQSNSTATRTEVTKNHVRTENRPSQGIVLSALLKCHGAAQSWLSLGSFLPPPATSSIGSLDPLREMLAIQSDRADSVSFRPALRPPRSIVG